MSVLLEGEVQVQGAKCRSVQHHNMADVRAGLELHPPESRPGFSTPPFLRHLEPHKDRTGQPTPSALLRVLPAHSPGEATRPHGYSHFTRKRPRLQGLETCLRPWGGAHGQLCLHRVKPSIQVSHHGSPRRGGLGQAGAVVPSRPGPTSGGLRVPRGEGADQTAVWLVRSTEQALSSACSGAAEQAAGTQG